MPLSHALSLTRKHTHTHSAAEHGAENAEGHGHGGASAGVHGFQQADAEPNKSDDAAQERVLVVVLAAQGGCGVRDALCTRMHTYTHTYIHTRIYIYIYIERERERERERG